jgi:hypothetical protein
MEKAADRPQDGPGANTLRGGLKSFATKTQLYNWLEDAGGPDGYRPGFTTEEYLSEAQRQQLGGRQIPLFGSGLPGTDVILHPREAKDIFQPSYGPGPKSWETCTQSTQREAGKTDILSEADQVESNGCNLSRKDLEEYRAHWSHDTVESKQLRFVTEAQRMMKKLDKFREYLVRMPPGSSEVLQRMREQLLANHGVLAMSRLKAALGAGIIQANDLNVILAKLNVVFTRLEFAKILPFFTATSEMPADRVHRVFVASTSGFESFEQPEYVFKRLFAKDRVSLEDVSASMSRDSVPATVAGLDEMLAVYGGWDGGMGVPEFSLLLHDMFSSAPYQYANLLKSIWG